MASRRFPLVPGFALLLLLGAGAAAAEPVFVPGFIDPQRHIDEPDLGDRRSLRFLTSDDYPPFNFAAPDGGPAGFNVDLARAVCTTLRLACTIEVQPFESLVPALQAGAADAVVAGLAMTEASRRQVAFSLPTMRSPARFVARGGGGPAVLDAGALARGVVGVQAGTAHEAFLRAEFPRLVLKSFPDPGSLRAALKGGTVDFAFADGIATALWLGSVAAEGCCRFVGGPYMDSRFFGDGTGIALRKGDDALRQAVDFALERLATQGVLADLYLNYFPVGAF